MAEFAKLKCEKVVGHEILCGKMVSQLKNVQGDKKLELIKV